MINLRALGVAALAAPVCTCALAVQVVPSSYAMPNGNAGDYTYFDESYNGSGCVTCAGAALSGGLGDLTDGVIATTSWNVAEPPAGPGPYVGWRFINPAITFRFDGVVNIDSVTISFDSNAITGVFAPQSVTIAGQTFPITAPAQAGPFSATFSNLGFVGTSLPVSITRNGVWVFASEVQFQATAVPEPATAALLLAGGVLAGGLYRRRPAQARLSNPAAP
jgi:hypothetical protein